MIHSKKHIFSVKITYIFFRQNNTFTLTIYRYTLHFWLTPEVTSSLVHLAVSWHRIRCVSDFFFKLPKFSLSARALCCGLTAALRPLKPTSFTCLCSRPLTRLKFREISQLVTQMFCRDWLGIAFYLDFHSSWIGNE